MGTLRRHTILRQLSCDLKDLPLSPTDGFVLTLLDGKLTLGDVAEAYGMTLAELFPHADRLLEVGAVSVVGDQSPAGQAPRSSTSRRRESKELARPRQSKTPPPGRAPGATAAARTTRRPTPRVVERGTPRATTPRTSAEQVCTLEEDVVRRILAFDAQLATVDHYTLLGVERGAEKAGIKRAYFALAAEFHPDRHFGQTLGAAGAALMRVFTRLTLAHDVLVNRARRAEYDASLPPAPSPVARAVPPAAEAGGPPASRPPAARGRRSTRKLKAVAASAPATAPVETPVPVPVQSRTPAPDTIPAGASPGAAGRSRCAEEALRRLYRGAKQEEMRRHVRVFIEAAEEAVSRDDMVAAANNYRLALQNDADPALRARLAAIEERSAEQVHERSVSRARAAERLECWADAARYFERANGARPEAWTAERAANALRRAEGDLHRALKLAEQAVIAEPLTVGYRLTLGEVCLAASLVQRAAGEAERALAIEPRNERALTLAQEAARRR